MSMSLRVVVPPHPLIGHWLTLLRDRTTPSPLFATAMAELGRWLTYEALRDWLPERPVAIETALASTEGRVIDPEVPLLAIPVLQAGLGLWQGAQGVLPTARVAHLGLGHDLAGWGPVEEGDSLGLTFWYLDTLPKRIGERVGVLVFLPELATGTTLLAILDRLAELGVSGPRLRVITTVAAAPGLRAVGERHGDLTVYCACIDPELDGNRVSPGCGNITARLYGSDEDGCLG
ncbi:MAG: uracil phosphoribosyltransferase [Cyanobium sp.]